MTVMIVIMVMVMIIIIIIVYSVVAPLTGRINSFRDILFR